jgi:hypothetical protein
MPRSRGAALNVEEVIVDVHCKVLKELWCIFFMFMCVGVFFWKRVKYVYMEVMKCMVFNICSYKNVGF